MLAEADFDARFSATVPGVPLHGAQPPVPDPFLARTSWHVELPLDLNALRLACDPLIGEHDFSSFCRAQKLKPAQVAAGQRPATLMRRVLDARWVEVGDGVLRFEVEANAFCHQMVRSIVGTLVEAGSGRRRPGELAAIAAGAGSPCRRAAGPPARAVPLARPLLSAAPAWAPSVGAGSATAPVGGANGTLTRAVNRVRSSGVHRRQVVVTPGAGRRMRMASNSGTLHEPDLPEDVVDRHRAIVSVMEELEAVDWYDQRAAATADAGLAEVLGHNRDEEKEHAAMTLEWLRRRDPVLDRHLRTYLFTDGDILRIEESAERTDADTDTDDEPARDLGIGSLRHDPEETL